MKYEEDYFTKYQALDKTPMGEQLTNARVNFVRQHTDLSGIDVGIGGGAFVEAIDWFGYDVNPSAVEWLGNRFLDPYIYPDKVINCISCWDVLEHIPEPEKLIKKVKNYVFVSIPIFNSGYHVLKSKHFKPGEHIYYFTNEGLINWFYNLGFELIDDNKMETELGREGINSYAFRRR